jgi:hypothetical protein
VSNDGQKLSVGEIFNLSEEYVQLFLTRISAPLAKGVFRSSDHGKRESDFFRNDGWM